MRDIDRQTDTEKDRQKGKRDTDKETRQNKGTEDKISVRTRCETVCIFLHNLSTKTFSTVMTSANIYLRITFCKSKRKHIKTQVNTQQQLSSQYFLRALKKIPVNTVRFIKREMQSLLRVGKKNRTARRRID